MVTNRIRNEGVTDKIIEDRTIERGQVTDGIRDMEGLKPEQGIDGVTDGMRGGEGWKTEQDIDGIDGMRDRRGEKQSNVLIG